jgi:hypothetical protein
MLNESIFSIVLCVAAVSSRTRAQGAPAPDVLPDPSYVRVKGKLAGANPVVTSTIVALTNAR